MIQANALAYDANFMDVYLNGVKQINGTDVTITSGNSSIVFASALTNGDIVDVVGFGTFQLIANINLEQLLQEHYQFLEVWFIICIRKAGQVLKVNPAGNAFILVKCIKC